MSLFSVTSHLPVQLQYLCLTPNFFLFEGCWREALDLCGLGQKGPQQFCLPYTLSALHLSPTGGPQLDWAALIPRAMVYRSFLFRPSTTMVPFYFPKKHSALEHLDPTVRTQWAYPVWKHVLLWRCLFPLSTKKEWMWTLKSFHVPHYLCDLENKSLYLTLSKLFCK